jgi:hypothetical protein
MWNTRRMSAVVLCGCLVPAWLFAAGDGTDERRVRFGFRLSAYPAALFDTGTAQASTAKPAADYTYTGSVGASKSAIGPSVEYRLSKQWSLTGGMHVRTAKYGQTTEIRNGRKNADETTDSRNIDTIAETTSVNYWEFPVLAQYTHGEYFVTGGLQLRHVGQVRTGTEYSYADGSTDYNENPATKMRSNQFGIVVGGGFLIVDRRQVKVRPELRWVRWRGTAFQGLAYRSASSQLEASIGFTF